MYFDKTWMGYGFVGGLEAGLIAMLVAFVLFAVLFWLFARQSPHHGILVTWVFLIAVVLSGVSDIWDLIYFNFAPLQSLQLLQAKLALVHDPDGIGIRVLGELIGAVIGTYLGWALFTGDWRRRLPSRRR